MKKLPKINFPIEVPQYIKDTARFRERPMPSKWAEENWYLTKVYAQKGKFRPYKWQIPIIDSIVDWISVYIVAPVRTGKTMISDIMRGYCTDVLDMGGMIIYPTDVLVRSNFKTRIIPTFREIPVMKKHLTGREDDLTIQQIILKNSIWNTASAQNKNQLAQYGAQFVQGDEVAKWRFVGFDPNALIDGRQKDYIGTTNYRKVYSSSPWEVGDMFYNAIFIPGTLVLTPHALCPWCKCPYEWSDADIRENLPKNSKLRKDPIRLKVGGEETVRYECPSCKKEIPEEARIELIDNTIWAAPKIETKDFVQEADIINPDGSVEETEDRRKKSIITWNWNRLLDPNYKFHDCLAALFSALKDPKKMRAYQSEDMAKFYRNDTKRKSSEYILAKRFGYLQYGPDSSVPEGVLVIVCSMDTQDNGFYCVHRGYGKNMETWLLRHEFIDAPMDDGAKNKSEVLEIVRPQIELKLIKKDGTRLPIVFGLVDRGGHRPEYVDYLCDHILWLHSYVGSSDTINLKNPMIQKSKSNEIQHRKMYVGQTRLLSDRVEGRMGSKLFHMPDDVTEEYIKQLLAQYYSEEVKDDGQVVRRYVRLPYDHYRDCENYAEGCAIVLGLEDKLVSDDYIKKIQEDISNRNKTENKPDNQDDNFNRNPRSQVKLKSNWLQSGIRRWTK